MTDPVGLALLGCAAVTAAALAWGVRRAGFLPRWSRSGLVLADGSALDAETAEKPRLSHLVQADPRFSSPAFLAHARVLLLALLRSPETAEGQALSAALALAGWDDDRSPVPPAAVPGRVLVLPPEVEEVDLADPHQAVTVTMGALRLPSDADPEGWYRCERVTLRRPASAVSPAADTLASLRCHGCDRRLVPAEGRCGSCGTRLDADGRPWTVLRVETLAAMDLPRWDETLPPPEAEPQAPPPSPDEVADGQGAFLAAHGAGELVRLETRVRRIWLELRQAWADRDPGRVASALTPALADALVLEALRLERCGLTAHVTGLRVDDVVPLRTARDLWYDSVVVWVGGTCGERLETTAGKPLRGFDGSPRGRSDRWTLIRRRRGEGSPGVVCPRCGGPCPPTRPEVCPVCDEPLDGALWDWILASREDSRVIVP